MIPEYDKELECYVGPDGCHYDSPQEVQYFCKLNLCGCGNPDEVHALLIQCAKHFGNGPFALRVDGIVNLVKENPEVVAQFIAHFLDSKGLTEHGGSVYGSWLTEDGYDFIQTGAMD